MNHYSDPAFADHNAKLFLRAMAFRRLPAIARADHTNVTALWPRTAFEPSTHQTRYEDRRASRMALEALSRMGLIRETEKGYAFTPFGSALAVALRKSREGDFTIRLFDVLDACSADILVFLCNLPSQHSVPDYAHAMAEAGLIRIRPRTMKADLVISRESLWEFFAYHPDKTPRPSLLKIPEGIRPVDRPSLESFHQKMRDLYLEQHPGSWASFNDPPPPVVDAADYDFLSDIDIEEFEF